MEEVRILATGLGFPEGPVAMPDGSVILTEIRNNRCSRVTPDGKVSLFSESGMTSRKSSNSEYVSRSMSQGWIP